MLEMNWLLVCAAASLGVAALAGLWNAYQFWRLTPSAKWNQLRSQILNHGLPVPDRLATSHYYHRSAQRDAGFLRLRFLELEARNRKRPRIWAFFRSLAHCFSWWHR